MIRNVIVEDTTWPVDVSTDDEDAAQWILRYGSPERREAQRMSVASILGSGLVSTGPPQNEHPFGNLPCHG